MEKFKFLKKNQINKIPKAVGVYLFKKDREFLYIGKAINIRERVKNHPELLSLAKRLGYIETGSEIEALILEANLIKKYQPKYNLVWRDDKNYFFVGQTEEEFPRIFWTHQIKVKCQFVGPFVDGKALKQTLRILRKVFPYRSCKNLPKRPCLWYPLGRCPAPCLLKSKMGKQIPTVQKRIKKECQQNALSLFKILQGKKTQVLKNLKKEMKKAAKGREFERAAKIRDQINSLEKVISHSKIFEELTVPQTSLWYYKEVEEKLRSLLKTKRKITRIEAYDVSNIQGKQASGSMIAFVKGFPDKNSYRRFKIKIAKKPNDLAMIKEILKRRFKHPEWPYPDLILIDGGKAQLKVAINSKFQIPNSKQIKIVALAKKKKELFIEGEKKPILLKNLPREIFNLILQLSDEAHRFARKYHLKLRAIDLFKNK